MYFAIYFRVIISLWTRVGPFINAKFGWNWPSGSGEENENVKSLPQQQLRQTTDKFWSEKLTWAFNSDDIKGDCKIGFT